MPSTYQPPFTITAKIISLIADISEQLGRLSAWQEAQDENTLRLRRINRIRTIQGSLAIEGNTLSKEQKTALSPQFSPQDAPQVTPQVKALLLCMHNESQAMGREALQQQLNLKDRKSFRARYLKPALESALIEMTLPDKPNSRLQQYRLTPLGRQLSNEQALSSGGFKR